MNASQQKPIRKFVCDFETTIPQVDLSKLNLKQIQELEVRVWLAGMVEITEKEEDIDSPNNFNYFFTIDHYMRALFKLKGRAKLYFHNLRFDSSYIICWLNEHGYKYSFDKPKDMQPKTYSIIMSDMGQMYSLTIKHNHKIYTFWDSAKVIPLAVEQIPKAYGLKELEKLKIEYVRSDAEYRTPTEHDIKYLKYDCTIVAHALHKQFAQGLESMTTASNALNYYKQKALVKKFDYFFPELPNDVDAFCRRAYRGGVVWCRPESEAKEYLLGNPLQNRCRNYKDSYGAGIVLDVNSMYPDKLRNASLPCGTPEYFAGEYESDPEYTWWIAKIRFGFEIKEDHMPAIQVKDDLYFCPTDYLTSSESRILELTVTKDDWEIIKEQYFLFDVEWVCGYKFMTANTLFKDYIDYWFAVKKEADITGNKGLRTIAKLMLNTLYGKFGKNPNASKKHVKFDADGLLHFELTPNTTTTSIYVPLACAVTAKARVQLITAAQANYARFLYCDTDSIHLMGQDPPVGIWVDDHELGAWKIETYFDDCKYLHAKCYYEQIRHTDEDGELEFENIVKCAGLPRSIQKDVTWDKFHNDAKFFGKLLPIMVHGGYLLVPSEFVIKDVERQKAELMERRRRRYQEKMACSTKTITAA